MSEHLEFGLDTFGDATVDADGRPVPHPQVLRDVVEQAVLADRTGLDSFGVGEHHRVDFAVSAPEVVLGTIAGRTDRIRLTSAVTVLSSDDPVRVYQRFATLDGLSSGRAEVVLGRGSFTESFPLFGHDLGDYGVLFEEKLDLFAALRSEGAVTWTGTTRPPLHDQRIYPTTASGLRTWVGVGGSPESVVRAARHGLPLMLAVIGGEPLRFAPYVELFQRALDRFGHAPQPVGMHSPGHVAPTDEEAREAYWPHWSVMRDRIGRERGWPPTSRAEFEATAGPDGALFVGGPDTVARKIARVAPALGLTRFVLKYSSGTLPHADLCRCIELYATEVVPRVRALVAATR